MDQHATTGVSRAGTDGGPRLGRFLIVTAPATVASLMVLPAIALGWVSVHIAAAQPIEIQTSSGSAQSVFMSLSTDQAVSGNDPLEGVPDRGVALLDVANGDLGDLCLVLRPGVPGLDDRYAVRITSRDPVHLGQITLAMTKAGAGSLDLPRTQVGAAGVSSDIPGVVAPGGFALRTLEGGSEFTDLRTEALSLVLDKGITLDALSLGVGLGSNQTC